MTREEFTTGLRRLRLAMSHQPITTEQRDTLFDLCSYVPSEAWPTIVTEAIRVWETWPRNFSKAVKELWQWWLDRNPQSQAPHQSTDCPHCWYSSGYIWAYEPQPTDLPYRPLAVFRCGHCSNAPTDNGIPRRRIPDLEASGYTIDRPTDEPIMASNPSMAKVLKQAYGADDDLPF